MASLNKEKLIPPGPVEPADINFPYDALDKMSEWFNRYGDIYKVFSPVTQKDVYVLNHPDSARHVLLTNHQNYTKGLGIDRVGILLGKGIMVSEGDLWKRQRRMIQPSFNRNVIGKMLGQIVQANMLLLERWEDKAKRGEKINLTEEVSDLILKIVLETIFSEDVSALVSAAGDNHFAILTGESARNLQFAVRFRALAKLVGEIINQRRQTNRLPFDFLAMLMASRDKQTGEPMNDKQLIDEVMTLIVAGHETTASALNWAWYLLSKHSDVEGQLHEEVDSLPAEQMDTIDGLAKLDYTKQVIEEALRLYPPGWFLTRRTVAEDEISGHYLAPKTDVIICPYLVHRHPEFWEEPEAFKPERFAVGASEQRQRFAYFPFAIGPRHCVGEFFAMVEMQIHLCLVAKKFKLTYVPDHPVALEAQVNLRSKYPFYMSLEKRYA